MKYLCGELVNKKTPVRARGAGEFMGLWPQRLQGAGDPEHSDGDERGIDHDRKVVEIDAQDLSPSFLVKSIPLLQDDGVGCRHK